MIRLFQLGNAILILVSKGMVVFQNVASEHLSEIESNLILAIRF